MSERELQALIRGIMQNSGRNKRNSELSITELHTFMHGTQFSQFSDWLFDSFDRLWPFKTAIGDGER